LRNPDEKAASFSADVAKLFEFPESAKSTFRLHSPWKENSKAAEVNVQAGKPYTFDLQPFELLVLEAKQ
jgi:hypothetical protein